MKGMGRFKLTDALPESPAMGETLPVEHARQGPHRGAGARQNAGRPAPRRRAL